MLERIESFKRKAYNLMNSVNFEMKKKTFYRDQRELLEYVRKYVP